MEGIAFRFRFRWPRWRDKLLKLTLLKKLKTIKFQCDASRSRNQSPTSPFVCAWNHRQKRALEQFFFEENIEKGNKSRHSMCNREEIKRRRLYVWRRDIDEARTLAPHTHIRFTNIPSLLDNPSPHNNCYFLIFLSFLEEVFCCSPLPFKPVIGIGMKRRCQFL